MMSFLALNSQVAEASVTMDERPITTAAKEMAFRQVMAFPFLGRRVHRETRPSCRVWTSARANAGNNSTKRCRWFGAPTVVLVDQLQLIARIRKPRKTEFAKSSPRSNRQKVV